jgi:DNA-binding transcriptional regulator YiaG
MTPEQVREHRQALGFTQADLAAALRMGSEGRRTVRRWESGQQSITGPASVALELLAARLPWPVYPEPLPTQLD